MATVGKRWGGVGAFALVMHASVASAQPRAPVAEFSPTRRGANRWEGSLVALSVGAGVTAGFGSPSVALSLDAALAPRVWLGRGFQLRGNASVSRPVSESDSTVRAETTIRDPSVALWFHGIPSFAGFHAAVAAELVFPWSKVSQARTLLLGTEVIAQLAWWRRVSAVTLFARAQAGWEHRLYEYTTPGVRSPAPVRPACFGGGDGCVDMLSGVAAITDLLWWSVTLAPRWRRFSPGASFRLERAIAASFSPVAGLSEPASDPFYSTFSTWLEFIPTPPLSVLLSYTLSRPVLDGDGTYGNPFWSRFQRPVVALTLVVRLDELVAPSLGELPGPGGVVRW